MRRTWSKERVVEAIRTRQAQGLPLTGVKKDDSGLQAAARKHFGNWPNAILAAGLQPKLRARWTRQGVIEAIRARSQQELPMTSVWKHDKRLYLAARRCLGNWQKALAAAGFASEPRRKWSRERVMEELRVWHRQPTVNPRTWDKSLASAITKYFGSLRSALAAAGLESKRRKWSEQRVIEAIQDKYVRGLPATRVGFGDASLASAAQRRFGSWRNAWLAAGLPAEMLKPKTHWTREHVIAEIRRWHERGLSLTTVWRDFRVLSAAAHRHFGSWPNALAAAGLAPTEERL